MVSLWARHSAPGYRAVGGKQGEGRAGVPSGPDATRIPGCRSGSWRCPSGSGGAPECKVEGGIVRWTMQGIKKTKDRRQRLRALWGERKASGSHLSPSCEPTPWFLLKMAARALGPQRKQESRHKGHMHVKRAISRVCSSEEKGTPHSATSSSRVVRPKTIAMSHMWL